MFIKTSLLSNECVRTCIYTLLFAIHDVSEEVNRYMYCLTLIDTAMLGVNLRISLLLCFTLLFSLLLSFPDDYSNDPKHVRENNKK
jgi:hypothetical protein